MLSRVADALYWMSRYVERAEHAARVLLVASDIQIDLAHVDPAAAERQWRAMLQAINMNHGESTPLDVLLDEQDPASILSAISRARENARQVREVISSEMWEHLNESYWAVKEVAQRGQPNKTLSDSLTQVVAAGLLWNGVTDGTMRRGEGWLFIKLGQLVERADRVSRLTSASAKLGGERRVEGAGPDNLGWIALLRACSAIEAYRKVHPNRVEPRQVVEFMVFDREFPRTVRHCVDVASDFAKRLAAEHKRGGDVERAFGRLAARLDYSDVDEVLDGGADRFLGEVLGLLSAASLALQRTYFLH